METRPLFSKHAEEGVLGAVLIDPWVMGGLPLVASDFYIDRHRWVWEAYLTLTDAQRPLDLLTLTEELKRAGKYEAVGGLPFLAGLANHTPTSQHAPTYAGIVKDYARRRRGLTLANELAQAAHAIDHDYDEAQAVILDQLGQLGRPGAGAVPLREWLEAGFNLILQNRDNPNEDLRVKTGFKDLDRMLGGARAGVFLVGGQPGVGKSILVENIFTWNGAAGVGGVLYSAEMRAEDMTYRIMSEQTGIAEEKLMTGELDDEGAQQLGKSIALVEGYPLFVSDATGLTTGALRADLTRLKIEHDIKFFVFDHLELLGDEYGHSEQERTAYLSRKLQAICKDLNLVGFVVQMMTKEGFKPGSGLDGFRGPSNLSYDVTYALVITEHVPPPGQVLQEKDLRTLVFKKSRFRMQNQQPVHLYKHPQIPRFYDPSYRTNIDLRQI